MDKDYLIQLTSRLYKLTLLFPKKEPLRYRIRGLADDILAGFFENNQHSYSVLKNLEILDSFFKVAKSQNWVSPTEILKLQAEYSKLKEQLKKDQIEITGVRPLQKATGVRPLQVALPRQGVEINGRQQKILKILREKGKAQVWEIQKVFPEVSKRTLRRDFEKMFNQGIIERIGERNGTFYQLKEQVLGGRT